MQTFFSGCLIFDKPMWDEEKGTLLHSKWAKLRRSGMLLVTGTKLGCTIFKLLLPYYLQ
jgi:hypothetical protein